MKAFYKKTFDKETLQKEQKTFNVLAALVCENCEAAGEEKFKTVILSAGTKFNKACNFYVKHKNVDEYCWGTCDGHAEAICYQLASVYMLDEICKLLNEKDSDSNSIFQFTEGKFELKRCIKFHLFVSQRPCGFMSNNNIQSLLSWKIHFTKKPHILQCSSKILIGSFLGIQGPLSCLLAKPVYISNVVIAEHFEETHNRNVDKPYNTETCNITPSIPEIKHSFVKFSQNLQSDPQQSASLLASQFNMTPIQQGDADFAVQCPHIFICNKNLYELFPEIQPASGKKPSPTTHSYFTFNFMCFNNVEQLEFGNGSKIIMYMKKILMQIGKETIQTHISTPKVYHQLKAYSNAIAKASQALHINRALEDAITKTELYIEAQHTKMDNINKKMCRRIDDLYEVRTNQNLSMEYCKQYLIKNKGKSETLAKLELTFQTHIPRLVEARERNIAFNTFRQQNCSSLTEIDCDWENYKQKMRYILLGLLKSENPQIFS